MNQNPSFRYDINGLRALAVIAVLIFHYNNDLLQGGFTGVDVFFVISGYLMTSIILGGLNNNSFSLFQFYKARAKRIVPALLVICLIISCIGYVLFEPMTYKLIGKHITASLIFISNIVYYNEAGYFEVNSQYKFLLHTWSLSVEWQFYIIYPIFLMALHRILNNNLLKIIILLTTIISLILSIYLTSFNPNFAFYMLPTRMWELLVGSLAFLYPIALSKNKKILIEILGVLIIIASFIKIPNTEPWSGYLLFIPVLGTYLCIVADNQKTLLQNTIVQKIGFISYSLYLTHWPIIVFYRTMNTPLHSYIYLLITISSAFCIYYFIERKRNYKYKMLCFYFLLLGCSCYISITGISNRIKNPSYRVDFLEFHTKYYGGQGVHPDAKVTHFNNNNQPVSFILTGDSHARQYTHYFIQQHINFIGFFDDGCMAMPDFDIDIIPMYRDIKMCPETYPKLKTLLQNNPKTNLIIGMRWDIYNKIPPHYYNPNYPNKQKTFFAALPHEIEQLIQIGGKQRQYFIIGQAFQNDTAADVFQCRAKQQLPFFKIFGSFSCETNIPKQINPASVLLKKISQQYPNVHFIDPTDVLCQNNQCSLIDKNDNPILANRDHLSIFGTKIAGKYILDIINSIK